jgi:hypothetical protein
MNFLKTNSTDVQGAGRAAVVVCAGTVAAEQAAEGDTMSSDGWDG